MSDDETPATEFKPAVPPQGRILSINEIVSYNLMRARRSNAWTQQDVADLLQRYTGRSWSNASVSAAERAWQGGRPRRFDVSEIVAMSKIFDVPIMYFFLPPEDDAANKWVSMKQLEDGQPNRDVSDPENDLMSLLPTADLLDMMREHWDESPEFYKRMRTLVRRYMGLHYRPSHWGVYIDKATGEFGEPEEALHANPLPWEVSPEPKGDDEEPETQLKEVAGEIRFVPTEEMARLISEQLPNVVRDQLREVLDERRPQVVENVLKRMSEAGMTVIQPIKDPEKDGES